MASRKSDYVRSDQLDDMIVPVGWLPDLFKVTERTIQRWLQADAITTFPNPLSADAKARAVRWGDIPLNTDTRRWRRKNVG